MDTPPTLAVVKKRGLKSICLFISVCISILILTLLVVRFSNSSLLFGDGHPNGRTSTVTTASRRGKDNITRDPNQQKLGRYSFPDSSGSTLSSRVPYPSLVGTFVSLDFVFCSRMQCRIHNDMCCPLRCLVCRVARQYRGRTRPTLAVV